MNNALMIDRNVWIAACTKLMRWPAALVGPLVAMQLASCDKPQEKKNTNAAAASAVPEPLPSVAPPAPPAPTDMDVAALERDLNCNKAGPKQACRILKDFATSQRYTAKTPSGEGRWVGQSYTVTKGAEKERELILWAKTVPTSQVGPGDLPIKVGYDSFPDELKPHAEKLVRALMHGDQPSPMNQAFPYVKTFVPSKQRVIVNTSGQSVHVTAEESIYIRAKAPRSVFIVNPSTSRDASPGDGMYAELWLAVW